MKVIGRFKEIEKLKNSLKSSTSELIVVYGRRRVGKTFLIREILKENIILNVTGLYKGSLREQLKNFHNQLKIRKGKNTTIPSNWSDAFELLKQHIEKSGDSSRKKVIFIDEFPWIASPKAQFLMWFENFWNSYCTQRNDLIVVVCGSAASYMVNNIVNNKGGLHNRITYKMKLEPFTLNESKLFLESKNIYLEHYDLLQLYMAIGGVPHYLEKIKKGESVVQNIDRLCFDKEGELTNEFDEVFTSLFDEVKNHIVIIKALAQINKGITRKMLLEKCNMQQNGFSSKIINELIESGFVSRYIPFNKKDRDSLIRLSDEYCMFYLKFIEKNKNQGKGTWDKLASKQTYKIWSGFAFETICLKHLEAIKNELGIAKIYTTTSNWQNEHAQIDLVIDRDDNRINICEIKFYNSKFTIDSAYLDSIKNKITEFKEKTKTRKGVYVTMITTYGINENAQSLSIVENSLTMDCLFSV